MTSISSDGTTARLLHTDFVTPKTRQVLAERVARRDKSPQFFAAREFKVLQAVCHRLFPQSEGDVPLDIAASIDERLHDGKGDGWRYDELPPDGIAFRRALQVLAERDFANLSHDEQDDLLRLVQGGVLWKEFSSARWFEELLAEASESYYSHPVGQDEIGYIGYADAHGWKATVTQQKSTNETPVRDVLQETPVVAQMPHFAPPSSEQRPPQSAQVVVIGTGAGAAPLLARLAQAGVDVVALEAGQWWNPAQDFATDERAQSKLFWTDERLSAGSHPLAFGNNNSGIGVGGSTLHYTAYTPRAQKDDFSLRSEFGVGENWPFDFDELLPYYSAAEQFLGVSGPTPYPWDLNRDSGYALPPLPLNGAAKLMQRACEQLGIQTSPAANAALSAPYFQDGIGWRAACSNRGFCQAGCSTGAKSSMDVTYLPLAVSHGAQIFPNCFVTKIETDSSGKVSGLVYVNGDGREERIACKYLWVCGGAIETPRLLLLNELGNKSGHVGRHFMAHTGIQVWGQFDHEIQPWRGIPGSLISETMHRPKDVDFAGGYLLQSIGVMPVTYASQLARGRGLWGEELRAHMSGYNRTAGINILGDCLPYEKNFVELSDEKDGRGLRKPRIHFSFGANETQMTAHAEKVMRDIWQTAGARDVWSFNRAAHIIGTCRMSENAASGVVNAEGQSWEIPNLYICDNSIFPSALSVNPALTIMALSLRCADRFLDAQKGAS